MATKATKAPIQAQPGPMSRAKATTGPARTLRPKPNSTRRRGIDHRNRKMTQGIRNSPPPFWAAMRGKRQMLPVPTAIPSMTSIMPRREPNRSCVLMRSITRG